MNKMMSLIIIFLGAYFTNAVQAQNSLSTYTYTYAVVCGKQYTPLSFAEATSENIKLPTQKGGFAQIAQQAYSDLKISLPFMSMESVNQFEKMKSVVSYVSSGGFDGPPPVTDYSLPKNCVYRIASMHGLNAVTDVYEILMDKEVWEQLSDAARSAVFIEAVKLGTLVGKETGLRKQIILALNGELTGMASVSDAIRINLAVELSLSHYEFLLKNQALYSVRRLQDYTPFDFRVDTTGAATYLGYGSYREYVTSSQFPQGGLQCRVNSDVAAPKANQKFGPYSCKPVFGGEKFLGLPKGMQFIEGFGLSLDSTELCANWMELRTDSGKNSVFLSSYCLQKMATPSRDFFPKSWVEYAGIQPKSFAYELDASGYSIADIIRYTGFEAIRDGLEFLELGPNTKLAGRIDDQGEMEGSIRFVGFRFSRGPIQIASVNDPIKKPYSAIVVALNAQGQPNMSHEFGLVGVNGSTPLMNGTLSFTNASLDFTNYEVSKVSSKLGTHFKSKTADITVSDVRKPNQYFTGDFTGYEFKFEELGPQSTVVVQSQTIVVQNDIHFYKDGQVGIMTPSQSIVLQNNKGSQTSVFAGQRVFLDKNGLVEEGL